jgi:nicotinamidase-related amidase
LIDFQPSFMNSMAQTPGVLRRAEFLTSVAARLRVPTLITEQYPSRMGGTFASLIESAGDEARGFGKMTFSATEVTDFMLALDATGRHQVILAGCETHICVNQTAHGLIERGYQVVLATDAICGRGEEASASALRRMVRAGAIESHTESIVYEWLQTAEHPQFREILQLVKAAAN